MALQYRCGDLDRLTCPYPAGTAQADAWYSGADEGHAIWRESQDQEGNR